MDGLRGTVQAVFRDWLVRDEVDQAMRYFDPPCFADPLMAENQCLFVTSARTRAPEAVKRDVRKTLAARSGLGSQTRAIFSAWSTRARSKVSSLIPVVFTPVSSVWAGEIVNSSRSSSASRTLTPRGTHFSRQLRLVIA